MEVCLMTSDIVAKVSLSKEEILHLYQGGVLSVEIKGKNGNASLEIYCDEIPEKRTKRIRFKHIEAE